MSLELIIVAAAITVAIVGYVLFVRIRMREKNDASIRNEKNEVRKQKHGNAESGDVGAAAPGATNGKTSGGRKIAPAGIATTVKKQRTNDANYQHPWLYTTLKGHTGQVFDIDFSRNGKYLATCADDSPSAQSSSGNHLINGNINGNDEQNATTTRSLSPASTSSSSAFSGVCDGKVVTSSSSSGSTRGEESPNGQGATKKQRKYTKKKQQYKKSSSANTSNSNGANAHKSSAILGTDPVNGAGSTSARSSSASPSLELFSPASSLSASTGGKHGRNQGRMEFCGGTRHETGTSQQRGRDISSVERKYHQASAIPAKHLNDGLMTSVPSTNTATSPLRQYVKLNLSDIELVKYLRKYVLDKDVMKQLGFPVEYGLDTDKAIIYKFSHDIFRPTQFYPSSTTTDGTDGKKRNLQHSSDKSDDNDSGQGSGTSSPTNVDDNDALLMYRMSTNSTSLKSPLSDMQLQPSEERECCRCGKGFFITLDGEYLTQEHCIYHWGRLTRIFSGTEFKKLYSCCNGDSDVKGCTINKLHVWTGLLPGFNGPFDGFVKTQPSERKRKLFGKLLLNKYYYHSMNTDCLDLLQEDLIEGDESDGVYALDCEMSYTGRGLELTKVTVVSADGSLVYEKLVKPDIEIVDYNTRYSGVTEADFADARNYVTIKQVQKDLLEFIFDDTILIGHSIENDLKVLKIIHKTVIDTSITFPHMNGFPFRQSLKSLTKNILKRDIQMQTSRGAGEVMQQNLHHLSAEKMCDNNSSSSSDNNVKCNSSNASSNSFGHCSLEDSRASLELMLWRVRKDKVVYDNLWNNNSCYRMQNN